MSPLNLGGTMKLAVVENEISHIIEDNFAWAQKLATKLAIRLRLPMRDLQEYKSAALIGLVEAANRYDPNTGKEFRQFAFLRVRGAVIDLIRKSGSLSARGYRYLKALEAVENLSLNIGLNQEQNQERDNLIKILNFGGNSLLAYRLSIDELHDHIPQSDNYVSPEELIESNRQKDQILDLVDRLPKSEKLVITEHYLKGRSFTDIAKYDTNSSKSWVSKLHYRALNRLKRKIN